VILNPRHVMVKGKHDCFQLTLLYSFFKITDKLSLKVFRLHQQQATTRTQLEPRPYQLTLSYKLAYLTIFAFWVDFRYQYPQ
jgi:hypothetical protein